MTSTFSTLDSLASAIGPSISFLQNVASFLGLAGFTLGVIDSSMHCSGTALSAVIVSYMLMTILTLAIVGLFAVMGGPIMAFFAGSVLGYASDFLRRSMTEGPFCSR